MHVHPSPELFSSKSIFYKMLWKKSLRKSCLVGFLGWTLAALRGCGVCLALNDRNLSQCLITSAKLCGGVDPSKE